MKMLLEPQDYYTQRNNQFDPYASCMPTSRVMFYKAAGISYGNPSGFADDDYFYSMFDTAAAKAYRDAKYPNLKDLFPGEIHGMYSWLDERLTGKRWTDFRLDLDFYDIVEEIQKGHPVMTSGSFPSIKGHAFVFVGYDQGELIAADPWGNPHIDYKGARGQKGYGIRYDKEYFDEHVKPGEKKWGHILIREVI